MKRIATRKPFFAWLLDHGNNYLSCLVEFNEDKVKKKIKCAKLCGEPIPQYFKVKVIPCAPTRTRKRS